MFVVFDKDKGLIRQTDSMSFCSVDVNRDSILRSRGIWRRGGGTNYRFIYVIGVYLHCTEIWETLELTWNIRRMNGVIY